MEIAADAAIRLRRAPRGRSRERMAARRARPGPPRRARADRGRLRPRARRTRRATSGRRSRCTGSATSAVITELNGWDAFSPGHLDQHLEPFYQRGLADGTLTREQAKELLECLFVKFNNHPAPPKVGVTAAESGTYTDFADIDLGGLRRDGSDGVGEVSYLLLEVIDELHLVQPSPNVQISRGHAGRASSRAACRVIRKGYGYPALFNADGVVDAAAAPGQERSRTRARAAPAAASRPAPSARRRTSSPATSTCPKILELALNDGVDPRTGHAARAAHRRPARLRDLRRRSSRAWEAQLRHFVDIKIRGNALIERLYATRDARARSCR